MRTIHKQRLNLLDAQVLQLPKGAKILTAQHQPWNTEGAAGPHLCIWYECEPAQELEPRAFVILGTGHPIPDTHRLSYIATVQIGSLVWHIYESAS